MILCKADTNELFLDGIIGADFFGEGITAAAVGDALAKLKGRATVRINSPGGSADEGVAIYNLLNRHAAGVDTHNEALAASAASIVFLAGENRTMERGSKLMIHRAHTIAIGNQADMAKMAEILALYDSDLAAIYAEHMDAEPDAILQMMDAETWFDAEAAIGNGLATAMAPTVRRKTAAAAAWFRHPPKDIFEEAAVETAIEYAVTRHQNWKAAQMRLQMR
jgi:ATP-dependent Clp protease, protease subunit